MKHCATPKLTSAESLADYPPEHQVLRAHGGAWSDVPKRKIH